MPGSSCAICCRVWLRFFLLPSPELFAGKVRSLLRFLLPSTSTGLAWRRVAVLASAVSKGSADFAKYTDVGHVLKSIAVCNQIGCPVGSVFCARGTSVANGRLAALPLCRMCCLQKWIRCGHNVTVSLDKRMKVLCVRSTDPSVQPSDCAL